MRTFKPSAFSPPLFMRHKSRLCTDLVELKSAKRSVEFPTRTTHLPRARAQTFYVNQPATKVTLHRGYFPVAVELAKCQLEGIDDLLSLAFLVVGIRCHA